MNVRGRAGGFSGGKRRKRATSALARPQLACSYFGNRFPHYVASDMKRLHNLGFARVVHTFSENDVAFYGGTMEKIVAASHSAGLEVFLDPWGVARVFGGEAFSRWILFEDDLRQRGQSGRLLAGACLNHPGLRLLMREWIAAAVAVKADGIFWDEPHWEPRGPGNPNGEFCVCEHCCRLAGDIVALPPADRELFRAASVVRLLSDLVSCADRAGLKSSLCVLPQGVSDQPHLPWDEIAALPGLSEFGTDPYWLAFEKTSPAERDRFIDDNAGAAVAAARRAGIASSLWVQAFRIPREDEANLLAGTRRLLSWKPDYVAIWGFDACVNMGSLACDDSQAVWKNLVDLVRSAARTA